jgi:hypothetical protein
MPRNLVYDVDVDVSAAELYGFFTTVGYWEYLVGFYLDNGAHTEIASFASDETGTDVAFAHIMTARDLPAIARRVVPDTFVVTREQHFDPFHAPTSQATGRFRALIPAPVEVTGDYLLHNTGRGSRMRLDTACRAPVPLIGGQIEKLVLAGLKMLFAQEGEFTAEWVAGHQ